MRTEVRASRVQRRLRRLQTPFPTQEHDEMLAGASLTIPLQSLLQIDQLRAELHRLMSNTDDGKAGPEVAVADYACARDEEPTTGHEDTDSSEFTENAMQLEVPTHPYRGTQRG